MAITEKLSNNLKVVIAIIIAILIIVGAVVYVKYYSGEKDIISPQAAADKAIKYINEKILNGQAMVSFKEVLEENGVYQIKFTLQGQEITSYATRNGKLFFPDGLDMTETENTTATTIGDFIVTSEEICQENGKPIAYFFGSEQCPHCIWEEPILESVVAKFGDKISFHKNITKTLQEAMPEQDVFTKYNPGGGVPFIVFGCKYYRSGSGEQMGEEQETKVLTALICKLTDNQPNDVCSQVQELISQVK